MKKLWMQAGILLAGLLLLFLGMVATGISYKDLATGLSLMMGIVITVIGIFAMLGF